MKALCAAAAAALATLGTAGAADAQYVSAAKSKLLGEYEPAGETRDCLLLRSIERIWAVNETTFLVKAGDYYLSTMSGRCARAADNSTRLEYTTPQGMLCSSQPVNIVDRSSDMLVGTCAFGQFEKLRPKSDAEGADS